MLDELTKSVRLSLYDRAVSPLAGAFLISWCLYNYRLLLTLFSELSLHQKLNYLDHVLFLQDDKFINALPLLILPFMSALLFLIIYPFPARLVFWFWQIQRKKFREVRQKIENETLITAEEKNSLEESYKKMMDVYKYDLTRQQQDISAYISKFQEEQKRSAFLSEQLENIQSQSNSSNLQSNVTDQAIKAFIMDKLFILCHNPQLSHAKPIQFVDTGRIGIGRNNNENSWQVTNGALEILQKDGKIHSRFNFLPEHQIFVRTREKDIKGRLGQFIIPELKIQQ